MASKILVIEDDRALRNAVVSYEVEFAADGSAGVQALSAKTSINVRRIACALLMRR